MVPWYTYMIYGKMSKPFCLYVYHEDLRQSMPCFVFLVDMNAFLRCLMSARKSFDSNSKISSLVIYNERMYSTNRPCLHASMPNEVDISKLKLHIRIL